MAGHHRYLESSHLISGPSEWCLSYGQRLTKFLFLSVERNTARGRCLKLGEMSEITIVCAHREGSMCYLHSFLHVFLYKGSLHKV